MKVLALHGGPRSKGNTMLLTKRFLQGVKDSGTHEIAEYVLDKMRIKPCKACDSCRGGNSRGCVVSDDMQQLYGDFLKADTVVMSTPIYCWSVSAQMKLFLDRLYGLDFEKHPERFAGKKLVLVLTYGDEDPNSGAELVIKMFSEMTKYFGMQIIAVLRYCSGEKHVSECPEELDKAYTLGRSIFEKE